MTAAAEAFRRALHGEEGVWVAFNWGGSTFVPFATELAALRYAAPMGMAVRFVRSGDENWRATDD